MVLIKVNAKKLNGNVFVMFESITDKTYVINSENLKFRIENPQKKHKKKWKAKDRS